MKLSNYFNKLCKSLNPRCGSFQFLLFLGLLFYLSYKFFIQREGFEGRKELLLLHMEGCPHCVKLMPEWKKFVGMNNTSILPRAVEKDEDRSIVKKYNVTGFPTILLLDKNGIKLETYEGPRTAEGLLNFLRTK